MTHLLTKKKKVPKRRTLDEEISTYRASGRVAAIVEVQTQGLESHYRTQALEAMKDRDFSAASRAYEHAGNYTKAVQTAESACEYTRAITLAVRHGVKIPRTAVSRKCIHTAISVGTGMLAGYAGGPIDICGMGLMALIWGDLSEDSVSENKSQKGRVESLVHSIGGYTTGLFIGNLLKYQL